MRFALRSLLVLFALYGLVFAIGDAYLMHGGAPLWSGLLFVVVLIGAQYLLDDTDGRVEMIFDEMQINRQCARRAVVGSDQRLRM